MAPRRPTQKSWIFNSLHDFKDLPIIDRTAPYLPVFLRGHNPVSYAVCCASLTPGTVTLYLHRSSLPSISHLLLATSAAGTLSARSAWQKWNLAQVGLDLLKHPQAEEKDHVETIYQLHMLSLPFSPGASHFPHRTSVRTSPIRFV